MFAGKRFAASGPLAGIMVLATLLSRAPAQSAERVVIGPPAEPARVPQWDARGLGPLPWQGIACADLSDDGTSVAVGTIAPHGDPNVFVLDANGKVVSQRAVGMRWINQVAVGDAGAFVAALSSTATGHAGDRPTIFTFVRGKQTEETPDPLLFHYGDHSNHLARTIRAVGSTLVMLRADYVQATSWPQGERARSFYGGGSAPVVSSAVGPNGRVVLGRLTGPDGPSNLVVLDVGRRNPLWQREPVTDVAQPPRLEKGQYGPPAPPYEDKPTYAPLAVAISPDGSLVAAADYQGWRRWFDTRRMGFNRFMPARPAIRVYSKEGKLVRRFGPETFAHPFWCDIAFSPDGAWLIAYPHNWTCRGLAGQTILPADEHANELYLLNITTGRVRVAAFPDAVSSVAPLPNGMLVACWNGRVYLLDAECRVKRELEVGGPALVDVSRDAARMLVAGTSGTVRLLDPDANELWRVDLNDQATPGKKPWTKNQRAGVLAPGIWRTNGGLAHSDMGGQYLIEAPEGLILIDPNAAASIEQNWALIASTGHDPMEVRYVLVTHEHGDHAPGSYLWRVITGAEVVAGRETAYVLQHHVPQLTGYGFHPPNPVDIAIDERCTLDLAGLQVEVIRLPGHTYGSLGYVITRGDMKAAFIGDVIMPGGTLGYSGSINFSATDIMNSLRQLAALKPSQIFGGHGTGAPELFIDKGIEVGEATGWAKMKPTKPDPFYGFTQHNYLVIAWPEPVGSAAYGDIDGDGRPDIALSLPGIVRIYLNHAGAFGAEPDATLDLPERGALRVRLAHLNDDRTADIFASSESGAYIFLSQGGLKYTRRHLQMTRPTILLPTDVNRDGRTDLVIGHRFVSSYSVVLQQEDGSYGRAASHALSGIYFDAQLIDLNGDGHDELVFSSGDVLLGRPDGGWEEKPAVRLKTHEGWTFMVAADFNGDGTAEVALLSNSNDGAKVSVFNNTGDAARPLKEAPDSTFVVPGAWVLRDGATIADWNSDGLPDLVLCSANERRGAYIVPGTPRGLDAGRAVAVKFDYVAHYDTKIGVADFNGDGLPDLASFGPSSVGAPAVYIWLKQPEE